MHVKVWYLSRVCDNKMQVACILENQFLFCHNFVCLPGLELHFFGHRDTSNAFFFLHKLSCLALDVWPFLEEKLLFTTKKGENKEPGLPKMQRKQEKKNEWQKKAFRAEKNNSELKEKGHEPSRAELKISQLELWLEPARLGLITRLCRFTRHIRVG